MARAFFWLALLVAATFYYFFFGAGPTASEMFGDLPWWKPKGWAMRWLPAKPLADMARQGAPAALLPIGLFVVPVLALLAIAHTLHRGAIARALALSLGLMMCIFVYYGYMGESIWRFFDWRFPAAVLGFSSVVAALAYAPSLLGSALRSGVLATIATVVAASALIFGLSTEITGTDPNITFNVSPWPILTLVGLLLVGYWLSAAHASAGLALFVSRSSTARKLGGSAAWLLGSIAAFGLGWLLATRIFQETGARLLVALSGVAFASLLAWLGPRDPAAAARSGLVRLAAGVGLFALIFASSSAANQFQRQARDETALRLLVALEKHKEAEGAYPESIEELVPSYLPEVPHPQIGLIQQAGDAFTYTGFGDSYALEFASVLWVQCQYSPPFEFEVEDMDDELEGGENEDAFELEHPDVATAALPTAEDQAVRATLAEHGLNGSWSCSETPPKLW